MQEVQLSKKRQRSTSLLAFDPLHKNSSAILSKQNLRVETSNGGGVLGTIGRSSGKWYFEMKIIQGESGSGGTQPLIGIGNYKTALFWPWRDGVEEIMLYCSGSNSSQLLYGAGGPRPGYGVYVPTGAVVGVALDMDARTLQFYKNGVGMGVLRIDDYVPGVIFYPLVCSAAGGGTTSIVDGLFGADLVYPPPAGYSAW